MSEVSILYSELSGVFQWNKSRIECFSMIIVGMISAQSVNLANISDHAKPSKKIKYDSIYKRIQRFSLSSICHLTILQNLCVLSC